MKDDYVSPLRITPSKRDLVGEDIFHIMEIGVHRVAVYLVRLEQKQVDHHEDGKSHHYRLQGIQNLSHKINYILIVDDAGLELATFAM